MKMNMSPPITNTRSFMADKFSTLRMQALRDSLWTKLISKNTKLATFPEDAPRKSPNRQFVGMEEIPVEQIIGTLGRSKDFDHKFRPLKSYLRERWVNVYLTLEKEGWPPIVVHKVGDQYYVEDGHHRVSVARLLGMTFIEAKVWNYPASYKEKNACPQIKCSEQSTSKVYAAG
jgi:hypothetical protein